MSSKPVEPVGTGRFRFTDKCPFCDGRGSFTPCRPLGGWFIEYHYQDGHEMSGPMTKEEAIGRYLTLDQGRDNATLIGDEGQIYTIKPMNCRNPPLCSNGCCLECDSCAAKPGSPVLCSSCLELRRLCAESHTKPRPG